jgi:hypothetical protein
VATLVNSVASSKSPTFRRGEVGSWQDHFTSAHKSLFKEQAGDLLVKLGYEASDGW